MPIRRLALGTVVLAATAASLLGLSAGAAAAQTPSGSNDPTTQVVMNGRLLVPAGRTDSSAVLFNGTATVGGTLTGALVVFNGDTTITGTVRKDVVVFNGSVTLGPAAVVGGDLVSRQRPQIANGATVRGAVKGVSGAYDIESFGWLGRLAWWVGYTVSTLVLGLLLLALAPRIDPAIARVVTRRLGTSFGFGVLWFLLLPIAAVLLIAVVVAIPLGVYLLFGLALVYTIGYVIAAHALGRRISRTARSRYVAFLIGWAILRVLALVPVLGGVLWIVASLFGLGVAFVAARERPQLDPGVSRPDTGTAVAA